jgi:nucleolar protein 53
MAKKADADLFMVDANAGKARKKTKGGKKELVFDFEASDKRVPVSKHELARVKNNVEKQKKGQGKKQNIQNIRKGVKTGYDLWDAPAESRDVVAWGVGNKGIKVDHFVEPAGPNVHPKRTVARGTTTKRYAPLTRKSTRHIGVKAVYVADPGQSYNPDSVQHEDVISEAVAEELQTQAELAYIKQPLYDPDYELHIAEESEEEEESDDEDDEDGKKKKDKGKMTRAQRNKQQRHKDLLKQQLAAKEEKRLNKSINRVGEIKAEFAKEDKTNARLKQHVADLKDASLREKPQRKIGRHTLKPTPMPVLLDKEIPGSLRTLVPQGNVATDRFESLHSRNKMELGNQSKSKGKQTKLKLVEQKGHTVPGEEVQSTYKQPGQPQKK